MNNLQTKPTRLWFLGKETHALLKRKGYDVSGLPMLEDTAVNKAMVLAAVQYW